MKRADSPRVRRGKGSKGDEFFVVTRRIKESWVSGVEGHDR